VGEQGGCGGTSRVSFLSHLYVFTDVNAQLHYKQSKQIGVNVLM
jgi:hypothetical protein